MFIIALGDGLSADLHWDLWEAQYLRTIIGQATYPNRIIGSWITVNPVSEGGRWGEY